MNFKAILLFIVWGLYSNSAIAELESFSNYSVFAGMGNGQVSKRIVDGSGSVNRQFGFNTLLLGLEYSPWHNRLHNVRLSYGFDLLNFEAILSHRFGVSYSYALLGGMPKYHMINNYHSIMVKHSNELSLVMKSELRRYSYAPTNNSFDDLVGAALVISSGLRLGIGIGGDSRLIGEFLAILYSISDNTNQIKVKGMDLAFSYLF